MKPLHETRFCAVTDSRPGTTTANDTPLSPTAPMTGVPPRKPDPDSSLHSRQRHPLLIATYGLLAVLVAVLATYWYLTTQESKHREEERLANLQKKVIEQTEQKQSMLNRLQDRIVTVERSLVTADTSKNRDRREKIEEQLAKVKVKVEEVRQLSPDQMSEIQKSCDDVEKKLLELQNDINKLADKNWRGHLNPEDNPARPVSI